jgi:hypothetical protein
MPTFSTWPSSRRIAVGVWSAIAMVYCVFVGIPFDRATQILFIVSAAVVFSVGSDSPKSRIFADWIPFFALLYGYDYSRGAAETLGFPVRVEEIYNIELSWFGRFFDGQIPTVWLQQHLYDPNHVAWWEAIVALTYCSHFVVPWAIVGTLYVRDRHQWANFARRIITISFAALITYVLVPAAPPWYASQAGLCDPIVRIATRGWEILGIPVAGQIVSLGQGVVNQFAAIPSLHAGTAFTISLFFWPRVGPYMRAFFVMYCATMVFTLAYGGEHYFFDAILGALYAFAVEFGCRMWERKNPPSD